MWLLWSSEIWFRSEQFGSWHRSPWHRHSLRCIGSIVRSLHKHAPQFFTSAASNNQSKDAVESIPAFYVCSVWFTWAYGRLLEQFRLAFYSHGCSFVLLLLVSALILLSNFTIYTILFYFVQISDDCEQQWRSRNDVKFCARVCDKAVYIWVLIGSFPQSEISDPWERKRLMEVNNVWSSFWLMDVPYHFLWL